MTSSHTSLSLAREKCHPPVLPPPFPILHTEPQRNGDIDIHDSPLSSMTFHDIWLL